jgi:hypothetical protein
LHNPGIKPLSALTVGHLVDIAADAWADRAAIVSLFQGHSYTFAEVREKVKWNMQATHGVLLFLERFIATHLNKKFFVIIDHEGFIITFKTSHPWQKYSLLYIHYIKLRHNSETLNV